MWSNYSDLTRPHRWNITIWPDVYNWWIPLCQGWSHFWCSSIRATKAAPVRLQPSTSLRAQWPGLAGELGDGMTLSYPAAEVCVGTIQGWALGEVSGCTSKWVVPSILVASTLEVSKTRISKPLLYTVGPGHFAVSWFFRMVWPKKATPVSLKCDLYQVPPISNFVLNGRKDQSDEAQPTGNRAWNRWI